MSRPRQTVESVLARVEALPSGCWRWLGGHSQGGYARASWADRKRSVHRVLYEELVGPIPTGLESDHLCRNRGCVNPRHIELVTRSENNRRGMSPVLLSARRRKVAA